MATGRPGRGVRIDLFRSRQDGAEMLLSTETNADGRCDAPLLTTADVEPGHYRLEFHAGDYLSRGSGSPGFYDKVPVAFRIGDPIGHYHVPLVLAAWGYATYRGAPPNRAPRDDRSDSATPWAPGRDAPSPEDAAAPPPGSGPAGLTTHVIDIAGGRGAAGLVIEGFEMAEGGGRLLSRHRTTAEGRTPAWLIAGGELRTGAYELRFHLGDYFAGSGLLGSAAPFFETARVRFRVSDPGRHHHVPLLAAPWGYTTYRGS
jgi:5-hydroxyisourate hydrolase